MLRTIGDAAQTFSQALETEKTGAPRELPNPFNSEWIGCSESCFCDGEQSVIQFVQ